MKFINSFISEYGLVIIYTLLTAIVGFIGTQIKKFYKKRRETKRKRKVVGICIKAVEKLYKDFDDAEKLKKVKENTFDMLAHEDIKITEIEIELLIESVADELGIKR